MSLASYRSLSVSTDSADEPKVICRLCNRAVVRGDFTTHLKEHHKLKMNTIKQVLDIEQYIEIVCPFCRKIVNPPLRHHLRAVHYQKLGSFAKGIYETKFTIIKRTIDKKTDQKIDIYGAGLTVQGGAYGLGKNHK